MCIVKIRVAGSNESRWQGTISFTTISITSITIITIITIIIQIKTLLLSTYAISFSIK